MPEGREKKKSKRWKRNRGQVEKIMFDFFKFQSPQEEEEKKRKEEEEAREYEEYLKLKEAFSVDEEGTHEAELNQDVSLFSMISSNESHFLSLLTDGIFTARIHQLHQSILMPLQLKSYIPVLLFSEYESYNVGRPRGPF